jgi:hypothetical protein
VLSLWKNLWIHCKNIKGKGHYYVFILLLSIPKLLFFSVVNNFIDFEVFVYYSLQKILIEYIMLDGVNDEEQHAHLLGKLLETFEVVNTQTLIGSNYHIRNF